MKQCKSCGALKAAHDFYANRTSCKECVKASVRANYQQNREHYREYERRRARLPHRIAARENYLSTDRGKERAQSAKRAFSERNQDKRKANDAVNNAVRDKKLWKAPCCMAPGCFSNDRIHGHHVDYSKPLSVVWLCASCHSKLHREYARLSDAA